MASEIKNWDSGNKKFLPLVDTRIGKVEFDPECIYRSLLRETEISKSDAKLITEKVSRFLIKANLEIISAPLIREIVNVYLLKMGFENIRRQYTRLGMPKYDIKLLKEKFHRKKVIIRKIGEWTLWEYDAVDDLLKRD